MTLKPMGNERAQNVRASFFFVEHTIRNIEKSWSKYCDLWPIFAILYLMFLFWSVFWIYIGHIIYNPLY